MSTITFDKSKIVGAISKLPDQLKEIEALEQWVSWKFWFDKKSQKMKKVPKNPSTGRNADTTDSATWGTGHTKRQLQLRKNVPLTESVLYLRKITWGLILTIVLMKMVN